MNCAKALARGLFLAVAIPTVVLLAGYANARGWLFTGEVGL